MLPGGNAFITPLKCGVNERHGNDLAARANRRNTTLLVAAALSLASLPALAADDCLFFATPRVAEKPADARFVQLRQHMALSDKVRLNPRRGSVVVRLTPNAPFGGYPAQVELYPGPPHLALRIAADWPKLKEGEPAPEKKLLRCSVEAVLRYAKDGNALETIKAETDLDPGSDLHAVWTWSGVQHRIYLNGKLAATLVAASPWPPELKPPLRLLNNYQQPMLDAAPIHEIAAYNFAMTADEVAQDAAAKDDAPLHPTAPHGPSVAAQWAPGEKRVYVALDTGNDLSDQSAQAEIKATRDSKPAASVRAPLRPDGFAETLLPLPAMPAGSYGIEATLLDAKGKALATATSDSWRLPETKWLGNTLGLTDKIQPPWTPIRGDGLTLKVWGRDYLLKGGFGLPQQIVSQGRNQLAAPVTLELVRDGQTLPLTEPKLKITSVKPHAAEWTGSATAGDVRVSVDGRLEYDGMVLLKLRLEPLRPGAPVRLDAVRLQTAMPKERALFLNTATDQGYWWYSYKAWIPEKPGVVHDNLKQRSGATQFLFFTLFFDHDTGLEWFADNLAGWQVNESKPIQEIIREPNGDVRLQCSFANAPFELREPTTITFGYDATPVKPLPPDWRSAYIHYAPLEGVQSDLAIWWLWSDSRFDPFRPNVFLLRPNDLEGFTKARSKTFRIKLAPFVNQHVTLPTYPERQSPDKAWDWFQNLLGAESANDGWVARPTRGIRDYWAWNLDAWIKSGGLEAIYIDEAHTQTTHASLLTGSGYVRPDGTHGVGHNTLGMRDQLNRVRQVFLDNGHRPIVWIPTYGMIIPHAFAFVDINSEGEAFMFDKPEDGDWIDIWGADFLNHTPGPGARGGPWLMSLGPAQKFGFIPVFLNYVKFYSRPEYLPAMRAQYALLGLLDIIPISPELGWFFKAKQDFGMSAPETAFHRFFDQQEIKPSRDDVKVSYYRRGDATLFLITNLGKQPYDGAVTLSLAALGLAAGKFEASEVVPVNETRMSTAYKMQSLTLEPDGVSLRVTVPSHNFRMIRLQPTSNN
jgi:hypothetical protein